MVHSSMSMSFTWGRITYPCPTEGRFGQLLQQMKCEKSWDMSLANKTLRDDYASLRLYSLWDSQWQCFREWMLHQPWFPPKDGDNIQQRPQPAHNRHDVWVKNKPTPLSLTVTDMSVWCFLSQDKPCCFDQHKQIKDYMTAAVFSALMFLPECIPSLQDAFQRILNFYLFSAIDFPLHSE